ncbi:MAG: hypothetical protein KJO40_16925 [Deltaproteobacteria bacterium]|nr:hypothetical protein [Deltaproteobacteria bacterium]NND28185.1 hypothetical protein [Myxococcales bacterium]NNK06467.1 hypothetical protein [Myxococcales bacterium]RZV52001.1 MAG: hypothetical protein EX268_13135 [Deltaproteobacteria bacterium]
MDFFIAARAWLVLTLARATVERMGAEPDKRVALKRWLRGRLMDDERAKQEWRQLLEATWDHLLVTPVRDLIDAATAKTAADQLMNAELVTELARPIAAAVAPVVIQELRQDERPLKRFVPEDAQGKLEGAIARPGLVHPDWVRAMFRGQAAEAVLNDALYRALNDFSTLLPRLMVKVSPMGRLSVLGSAGAIAEKLITDLERRLEPEIKSFLSERSEQILERAAEFAIGKLDDPASIEFRANLVRFVLSKSPAFLVGAADDELLEDIGVVAELSARHVVEMPELRADIHTWIDRAMGYAEGMSLGEALHLEGIELRPPIEALAEATWPAFIAVLGSPQAQVWMDTLLDELIDEYDRMGDS